jgi:glycosyltransferase involved in cell wall biosynthesis
VKLKPTVSLVIPMFNEELNIEHAIECAVEALEIHTRDYEIIIVDDASTDRSSTLVERAAAGNDRVHLIRHPFNQKLGASLRTGFAQARMEIVLYMDADLPFDPYVLGHALRGLFVSRADMITGYRFDRTSEGLKRTLYSVLYNWMIRLLFGSSIRDINFSFKLMRREVLDAVELKSEGSLIDAELVLKAKNLGFVIQQIGLDYFPRSRGESTLSSPTVIRKIFREMFALYGDIRRPKRRNAPAAREIPEGEVVRG